MVPQTRGLLLLRSIVRLKKLQTVTRQICYPQKWFNGPPSRRRASVAAAVLPKVWRKFRKNPFHIESPLINVRRDAIFPVHFPPDLIPKMPYSRDSRHSRKQPRGFTFQKLPQISYFALTSHAPALRKTVFERPRESPAGGGRWGRRPAATRASGLGSSHGCSFGPRVAGGNKF